MAWIGVVSGKEPAPEFPEKHAAFFEKYCLECHDSLTEKGKVNLEEIPFQVTNLEDAERWQKVLNSLNSGEMPPEDEPQPENAEKAEFLDALAQTMVAARRSLSDSGGKITMRRLNRREYQNTIEELTGVRVDVESLPTDGGSGTFDTVGASQFISSDQFEQYLKIGRDAIDEMFERRAALEKGARVFRVEPETTVNVQSLERMKQLEDVYARYLLWKAEVDRAALAPENKNVIEEIKEKYRLTDVTDNLRLYQNAGRLSGIPDAKKFGFRDANDASFSYQGGYSRTYAYVKHYAELPHSDRGTYLKLAWAIQRIDLTPKPKNLPPGTYRLRVRAGTVEGSPAYRHFIQIGHPQRVNQVPAGFASLPLSSHQVTGTIDQPEIIETQVEVGLHTQREFAVMERQPTNGRSLRDAFVREKRSNGYGISPAIWIDWLELEGPLRPTRPASVLQKLFEKNPDIDTKSEPDHARRILTDFAFAALRQVKPDPSFLDQLVALFQTRRDSGESFDIAIRTPLSVILASPGFLYLNEPTDKTERRQLTDRELAVRLAYFLWSAPPDQRLLDLASRNELHQPEILRQQVDRLIADPRSDNFVAGFLHQWLDMERLDFFQFDVSLHREFDENTRAAAREEVYQTFAHLLRDRENGRLGHLLKSDSIFVNGLLATHYGIDGVTGDEFQKVTLPADSPRGGLLGMAAIHAMGSDGVESSPVERGAWVLRHLLHDPPPPAPPNVPQLSRLAEEPLTTREKLAAHMEEAQCASCHRKIDPIGFGLENFDAAGKWRTTDAHKTKTRRSWKLGKTWEIDPAGAFHNGPEFANFFEMRDLIAAKEGDFARGFTEHLIEYALGRPFGFTDEDLANEIVSAGEKNDFSARELIQALVQSAPFRMK